MVDLRKVPHAFWSNYYRFSIRMVFAAYLLEMHIWCCLGVGHLYPIFKPHREAFAAFPKGQIPDKCPERGGGGLGNGHAWNLVD